MAFIHQRKPRICVLTYKALTRLLRHAESRVRDRAEIIVDEYTLEDAVLRGRQMQQRGDIDVLVSAGSIAVMLRSQLDLPVVSIEVTGFDLLLALQRARQLSSRVGMVIFRETMPLLDSVKDLLKVELFQFSYETLAEARGHFQTLMAQGIEVVVGSSLIVDLAEQNGLHGILIYSNDSDERALEEAVQLGENAIRQDSKYENLNAAFAHLHEAILAVDMQHRITAINPLMRRILGLDASSPIGLRLPDLASELSLASVLAGQDDDLDMVIQLGRSSLLMNRTAIHERGSITGALLTLRDTSAIHRADTTIRSQRRPKSVAARYSFDLITGNSPALAYARGVAGRCARTASTVLITGETGTGKELFAQAIHNASERQRGPFVALNCASFPESLLESELFGHEEGAFTGSRKGGKPGLFEAAHTGTVFLDEIVDMPISLQTRLLRVLQERTIDPVGAPRAVAVDVRVIAATHRDLEAEIAAGRFREDLYYRLNVLPLNTPTLRERVSDIPLLLDYFAKHHAAQGQAPITFSPDFLRALQSYQWPGNVRELSNLIDRFSTLFAGERLALSSVTPSLLPKGLAALQSEMGEAEGLDNLPLFDAPAEVNLGDDAPHEGVFSGNEVEQITFLSQGMPVLPPEGLSLKHRLAEIERDLISQALSRANGNVSQTARILNLQRTTLIEKIQKFGLRAG